MGTAARRRALSKKLKAIEESFKTKRLNQNPKLKNNGNWLKKQNN